MTQSMKWKSELTDDHGEFEWDDDNEDMTIWQIGLLRKEAQDKQAQEEIRRKAITYEIYRQFIRNEV